MSWGERGGPWLVFGVCLSSASYFMSVLVSCRVVIGMNG